jgi:hypothetical protein
MNTARALILGMGNLVAHPAHHKSAANDNDPVPTPPAAIASSTQRERFVRDLVQAQRLCQIGRPYGVVNNAMRRRVSGRSVWPPI